LSHDGVERFLVEAHQQGLLEYHAAGTVIRLTFPVHTLVSVHTSVDTYGGIGSPW
jgi:hypothetical protein